MRMNTDREHSEQQTKQSRWGFRGKTVWNWMELLIVPLALAVIGLAFSVQQDARQERVENQRAEAERELAVQRAQDEALQAYLDQMSTLLLEKDLRDSEAGSEVRTLALARTHTVLESLGPSRKSELMQFLLEADLVEGLDGRDPIIELGTADLKGANLTGAVMPFAYLSGANLRDADLRDVNLTRPDQKAFLRRAHLLGADLSGANLRGAEGFTNEEIEQEASSLKGATMPNGQKYQDWLNDR
jgi:cell division protein FtsB